MASNYAERVEIFLSKKIFQNGVWLKLILKNGVLFCLVTFKNMVQACKTMMNIIISLIWKIRVNAWNI